MPLIIHPSSCCDVCLDPFTYDEPRPPHALPCGHIFCRDCLNTMQPSICPLCRKLFIPGRSKKLITGDYESGGERTPIELLKRLVVSWDGDTSETVRTALVSEVNEWLGSGNTHVPLAKAHQVINAYHSLKAEEDNYRRSIRHLQRELEQLKESRIGEKEEANAVQQSLLEQIEDLHTKAARYEAEIEAFRKASTTIAFRHNPLPAPPEPYPLENLPSFARRYQNGEPAEDLSGSTGEYPVAYPSQPTGVDRKSRGKVTFASLTPQSPSHRLERSPSQNYSGWFKNEVMPGASPNQRFVPNSVLDDKHEPDTSWAVPIDHSRKASRKEAFPPYGPIPGTAEHSTGYVGGYEDAQRHLPSSNRRPRASRHVTDPEVLTHSPLLEPPEGFQVSSRPHPVRAKTVAEVLGQELDHDYAQAEYRQSVRRSKKTEDLYLSSSQHVNARALPIPPAPPSVGSSTVRPGDEWHHSSSRALPSSSGASSSSTMPTSHPIPSRSSGPSTIPPLAPSPTPAPSSFSSSNNTTSTSSRTRLQRRMSEAPNMESSWRPSNDPYQTPPDSGSNLRRRSAFTAYPSQAITYPNLPEMNQPVDTQRSSVAESYSSWGTVNTANPAPPSIQPIRASAHFVPAHDVISVHDLPLRSFEDVQGDAARRGSLNLDIQGLQSSPARLDSIRGYSLEDNTNITPRVLTRAHTLSDSVHSSGRSYSSRESERRRDTYSDASRDSEIAQGPPPVAPGIFYRPELTPAQTSSHAYAQSTSSSHRSSRTRHRISQPDSTPTPSQWSEMRHTITPTPADSNALGLSDIVPSPEPRISAPTPVVSTKSFLQSFSQDRYH